jgi:hypothetical protein
LTQHDPAVVGDDTEQEDPPAVGTGTLECLPADSGAGQRAGWCGVLERALGGTPLLAFERSRRARDLGRRGVATYAVGYTSFDHVE